MKSCMHSRDELFICALKCYFGIHRWPVNSPYKGQVMQKMFPFDDVIMFILLQNSFEINLSILYFQFPLA